MHFQKNSLCILTLCLCINLFSVTCNQVINYKQTLRKDPSNVVGIYIKIYKNKTLVVTLVLRNITTK